MRVIREINEDYKIENLQSCTKYLDEFKNEDREHFIVLGLDSKNKVIYREITHIGTLNSCIVHPREVFKKAIIMSSNAIIIAHNHPGGSKEASPEDISVAQSLIKAGEILNIKVLDSIIITRDGLTSYQPL